MQGFLRSHKVSLLSLSTLIFIGFGLIFLNQNQTNLSVNQESSPQIAGDGVSDYYSDLTLAWGDTSFSSISTTYEDIQSTTTLTRTYGGLNWFMRAEQSGGQSGSFGIVAHLDNFWQIFAHQIRVSFRYRDDTGTTYDLYLEVLDAAGTWQTVNSYSAVGSTTWTSIISNDVTAYNIGSYNRPIQIRFRYANLGASEFFDLDDISISYQEYLVHEVAASVNSGSPATIEANVTPAFSGTSDYLQGVELQYDYDGDFGNGWVGNITNQTIPHSELSFIIPGWAVHWNETLGTITYRIHSWTSGGSHRYSTAVTINPSQPNLNILDSIAPKSSFKWQNLSLNYYDDLFVQYNITDQINASGLDFSPTGQVRLRYKVSPIAEAPGSVSDNTGSVSADLNLNPGLRPGGTWITGAYGSFFVNFTIPKSSYSYGDTIYHWIYDVDRAGNINHTWANYKQIYVNDSIDPQVVPLVSNTVNASFQADKNVTFWVYKPTGGAALDAASVQCHWADNPSFTGYSIATKNQWGVQNFSFIIPAASAHYGNLDEIVYFRLNASDVIGNNFLTEYQYKITDLQAPQWTLLWQNFTSDPNYDGEYVVWKATILDPDVAPSTCAKLSSAFLYVRNGTPATGLENWTNQYPVKIAANDSVAGKLSVDLQFTIGPADLSAQYRMFYLIQVNDSRYGVLNITGNFHVKDSILPYVRFDRARNTTDGTIINYNENAAFWFEAREPVDAAGFNESSRPLMVVRYKVGDNLGQAPANVDDRTGEALVWNTTFTSSTGGYFVFYVPHTAFKYNDYVWAWVNITDTQFNNNFTFQLGQVPYVRINDTILPDFTWATGHHDNDNSYHLAKLTQIIPAEPSDASGITAIRIYWRNNSAVVLPGGYTRYLDITNFTVNGGVTLYVTIPVTDFWYGETIHYVFQVTDAAGNKYNSTDHSFLITDTLVPNYTTAELNALFFWNVNGKSKNFTFNVSDPDFALGRSSGIARVEFFYQMEGIDADYLFNGTLNPGQSGGNVTFHIPYNLTFGEFPSTGNLRYRIRVFDKNESCTEYSNVILVANTIDCAATSPKPLSQWNTKYYRNSHDLTFTFTFTGALAYGFPYGLTSAVWYQIEGQSISGPYIAVGNTVSVPLTGLPEGHYNITFWHHNATYVGRLEFKIDLTPPANVASLSATMVEQGVQLTWSEITDEDIVSYIIYRGFKPDFDINTPGDAVIVKSNLRTASVVDNDILLDMTTYYYRVYAVDLAGNLSPGYAATTLEKPLPPWMWIVIAGIAVGVVVGLVVAVRARGERKLLVAAMDKSSKAEPVTKEEDWTRVAAAARKRQESAPAATQEAATKAASEGKKWATIQTASPTKATAPQPAPAGRGAYWQGELGELLAKVVQAEEAGNFAEELRVLEIVQRVAQQMQDQETVKMAQQKTKDIWAKLNAQN